jgi:Zn-dependent protease
MRTTLEYLVPLVVILVLSMMLHEIAHGYAAYKLGDPTAKSRGRLSLNPIHHLDPVGTAMFVLTYLWGGFIFGWAKPVPISPYYFKNRQRGMGLVGIAGPATNFALAAIFWALLTLLRPSLSPEPGYLYEGFRSGVFEVLFLALKVNVVLGVFNLIPIPPLDGSRVLGAFLPRQAYERWASLDRYGWIILIVLMMLLVYSGSNFLGRAYDELFSWLLSGYFG